MKHLYINNLFTTALSSGMERVCKRLLCISGFFLFFIVFSYKSSAQDIHFSQYYANPALLNPATTGNFNGKYRAGLNYRTQWGTFTVPWRTYDIYGDLSFLKDKKKSKFFFGAGMFLGRDVAGDGVLSVTKVLASGAIHYKINNNSLHTLSGGLQVGLIQKSIDWSKLYFDNQWTDGGFDRQLPTYENYSFSHITYPDVSTGLLYSDASEKHYSYYLSIAENHILQPKEAFYNFDNNNLGTRTVFSAGVSIKLTDLLAVSPSVEYMNQKSASETLVGGMLGYDLSSTSFVTTQVFAGVYVRLQDAFIPTAGLEYGPWKGFISYDSNFSSLNTASHGYGAVELSLVYVGGIQKFRTLIDIPCPRF